MYKKIAIQHKIKPLLVAISVTATFFLIWDEIFTQLGVWGFNPSFTSGLKILNLPLEEILFFFCIPMACMYIYFAIQVFFPNLYFKHIHVGFGILGVILMVIAIFNFEKKYTLYNFLFASIFLIFVSLKNPNWLTHFTLAYIIHLFPFAIVNGILTGSGLTEPVVWYNDNENLHIRFFTIPIEDFIYSLLLFLMNVTFFEWGNKSGKSL